MSPTRRDFMIGAGAAGIALPTRGADPIQVAQRSRTDRPYRRGRNGHGRRNLLPRSGRSRDRSRVGRLRGPADASQGALGKSGFHDPRLSRGACAPGHRRRDHRHSRPLACPDLDRCHECRQRRVCREADGSEDRGRTARHRSAEEDRSHPSGRQPARQLHRVSESERSPEERARSAKST